VAAPVISVRGLRKSYDGFEAVRGIDLEVGAGEIFAFLGPNGAGKTTTVEILEGYRTRNAGEVSVLGIDPQDADRAWRNRVGFVLQESRLVPELTPREAVEQYAGYYSSPMGIEEVIRLVGLEEKADVHTSKLSGGQQRRLDVALAIVGDPELLFLDEPTTGFDPSARRQAWDVIAGLSKLGKTIFLTTHYMDEAQTLADRGMHTEIRFRLPTGVGVPDLPGGLGEEARVDAGMVTLSVPDPVPVLRELTTWAERRGVGLPGLTVGSPNLEDVYLELTDGSPAGARSTTR
jgi:ABC-2 type transport system ATP-binding protein